jgi:hypothetical protein
MHGRARHHFDGFQIQVPGLSQAAEEDMQEAVYFAGDLRMDRSSRFFSCGVQVSPSD